MTNIGFIFRVTHVTAKGTQRSRSLGSRSKAASVSKPGWRSRTQQGARCRMSRRPEAWESVFGSGSAGRNWSRVSWQPSGYKLQAAASGSRQRGMLGFCQVRVFAPHSGRPDIL